MDKLSERRADSKPRSGKDVDIGVYDHGAGGKCETLDGLWHKPNTITGGSADQRLRDNNYCKTAHAEHAKKKNTIGGLLGDMLNDTSGPPYLNTSKPHRVF